MYIFILPISGGRFVSQLAGLQYLCENDIKPNVTLASSGGNVAALIASAANWKWAGIERVSRDLTNDLFAMQWSNISVVSSIIGWFQASRYKEGKNITGFLNKYFTKETIMNDEVWTGTFNKDQKRTCLFCNKKDSILDISYINFDLTQSTLPIFANGDINLIGKYGTASASIPSLVPPQKIIGSWYEDGGVSSSSPLTVMSDPILNYVVKNNSSMHLIYLNSINLSNHKENSINNIIDNIKITTEDFIRSSVVNDRLAAYKLLKNFEKVDHDVIDNKEFICNYINIEKIKTIQTLVKYSLLEIYPNTKYEINIINFNGDDIINEIHKSYKDLSCRFWYISSRNSDNLDKIDKLLTSIT
jgi:predicted acylesterase/phospholipase RssA